MTFAEFWPHYVLAHRRPATRALHAVSSLMPLVFIVVAIVRGNAWWVLGGPVAAYAIAWFSHFFIEHNRPATWEHFWLSLAADYKMFALMLTGRMGEEVRRVTSGERRAS
jgi:hypothetical protein